MGNKSSSKLFLIRLVIALATVGTVLHAKTHAKTTEEIVPASIHPELRAHTEHFAKKIYKVGENVYSAVGWNVAGIVMIEGDDGIILVDAGLSPATGAQVMKEFRKITDKPVVAVIYSHFHHDHVAGIKGLVSVEEVEAGKIAIYAHSSLVANLVDESALLGPITAMRTGYTFGFFLDGADTRGMNAAIGPIAIGGKPGTFIAPTHLIDDQLNVTIAGVELQILHAPSEAPDELAVYLPESRILIDTEVIQGPTFPNMYTLRGTRFRDPVKWVQSIDRLRKIEALHLVPTHGQPVSGQAKVEEVLRMSRDGIQYVHDQTVRHMNRGLTPDELAQTVKLPRHLFEYTPYLRQYYGTVEQAVREIYVGYLGWYEGDPVGLSPIPPEEQARRLVELMGGRQVVLGASRKAYGEGDYQWAAELASYLIRIDQDDMESRRLKANAFRRLGYASMNINWRNWYLTSARELEGLLDTAAITRQIANVMMPPDMITEVSAETAIQGWTTRLIAEDTLQIERSITFEFEDLNSAYALTIRNGVCQFDKYPEAESDLHLTLTKSVFDKIQLKQTTILRAIAAGEINLRGDRQMLEQFLGYFEEAGSTPISLTVR